MKKLLLASALAALAVSAQASTDLYGKAGAWITYADDGDNSEVDLGNRSTRLGVKGSEKLTDTTDLVYKLEYALALDENEGGQFTSRDTWVGFNVDGAGEFHFGRSLSVDDYVNQAEPSDFGGNPVSHGPDRWNNSLFYMTPEMSGMQFLAQYAIDDNAQGEEGSYVVGATYSGGPVSLGASYKDLKNGVADTAVRVSGAYDMTSQLNLSANYHMADFNASGSETENGFSVGVAYDIANSPWDAYVQFDSADDIGGVNNAEMTTMSVGGNYSFTDATTGSLYLGVADDGDDDVMELGMGIVHSF